MTVARVFGAELEGIDARLVEVEADVNVGLHSFTIVGLADKALNEARERVNSALKHAGVRPPNSENRRITVNLAPADVKKTGSQYDLPVALAYLVSTLQLKTRDLSRTIFAGELALDGTLRPIRGALNIALLAAELGFEEVVLPEANAPEATLVEAVRVTPTRTLSELLDHLEGRREIEPQARARPKNTAASGLDFEDIRGQESAKRALIVAAAGGHNLLMVGPPGSGKTLLARALASILPDPSIEEIIDVSKIWSAAGLLSRDEPHKRARPFREPHHTASAAAIVGGGTNPRPGEISLAHRGVLFLDELPEFHRDILESLRQPLEEGVVNIARAKASIRVPARFQFVSAMNPCPCGFYGDPDKACVCTAYDVLRYQKKISGPLLDRIDIQIRVPRMSFDELKEGRRGEASSARELVARARARQEDRLRSLGLRARTASEMSSRECDEHITLTPDAHEFAKQIFDQNFLSTRSYYRLLKTAQTIADLEESDAVAKSHLAEAFQYRMKVR